MSAREALAGLYRRLDAGGDVSPNDLVVAQAAAEIETRMTVAAERAAESKRAVEVAATRDELIARVRLEIPGALDRLDVVAAAAQERLREDPNAHGYIAMRGIEFGLGDARTAWSKLTVALTSRDQAVVRHDASDVRAAVDATTTESRSWVREGLITEGDIDPDLQAVTDLATEIIATLAADAA